MRIPADHLVGPEHGGWELAKVTLGNERVSLSGEGALWGMGPTAEDLVDLVRGAGGVDAGRSAVDGASVRDRLVDVWIEAQILRVLRLRMVSAVLAGRAPGAEASVRKAIADAHGQHIMDVARDLAGAARHADGGRVRTARGGRGPDVVPRLPLLARPDRRRRHGRGAAQHRGRKGSRSAARSLSFPGTHSVRKCSDPRRATAHGERRSGELQLERPGVGEALPDALAGPGGERLGLVEHQVGVAGMVP